MGRWGVMVGCALLVACGASSGGSTGTGSPGVDAGSSGDSGVAGPDAGMGDGGTTTDAGPPGPDAGVDGGTAPDGGVASCRPPPAPGACSLKPVLGSPRTFQVALSSNDGSDGGLVYTDLCDAVLPSDGAGRPLLVVNRSNEFYPYFAIVHVLPVDAGVPEPVEFGPPLRAFPLESGWVMAVASESINGHVYGVDLGFFLPPFDPSFHDAFGIGLPVGLASGPQGGLAAAGPQAGTTTPCPPESMDEFRIGLRRFAPDGTASPVTELGCVFDEHSGFALGESVHGDVIALLPDGGWHVAPDGKVSTFPPIAPGLLEPLLDGRFARKYGESLTWDATISVDGSVTSPPCWLAERSDVAALQIVLDGRAYLAYHDTSADHQWDATVSCDRYVELILADGSSCGFIPLSGTDGGCNHSVVSVGLDGTLTTLDQTTCTASAWSGAFR